MMLFSGILPNVKYVYVFVFFFSSRRRHTRLQGDWSSDVCSSDLSLEDSGAGFGYCADPARRSRAECFHFCGACDGRYIVGYALGNYFGDRSSQRTAAWRRKRSRLPYSGIHQRIRRRSGGVREGDVGSKEEDSWLWTPCVSHGRPARDASAADVAGSGQLERREQV